MVGLDAKAFIYNIFLNPATTYEMVEPLSIGLYPYTST
ncbi:hypothetical protein HRbin02_01746 [Candidatus Calditenuaceae archaeon HR02]|nr:hypothetical protein HRbin02_01746 [Candidatus Calditenuaceae archaeon HR02]